MNPAAHPDKSKAIRILLVDDHPVVRDGLAEAINAEPDLVVCATAEDRQGGLQAVERTQPHVAVIDLTLRNSSGLELLKDIHARWPEVLVLVVSMHEENLYAERVVRAGARGYITKQQATYNIVAAIRQVLSGEVYLSEGSASAMLKRMATNTTPSADPLIDRLADRELQVFELTGNGLSLHEIAAQLGIDVKTVETYRLRIRQKLGLNSANELLKAAIQWMRAR